MKKRKNINKIIIVVSVVVIGLIGYNIYYKNSKTYNEFQESSQLEELIPYEEEKQSINWESGEYEKFSRDSIINREEIGDSTNENKEEMLIVHITGEVKNWGVIELPQGSRIIDAVNKAGGFTDSADVDAVNLAYVLSDGIKVYIPSKNEDEIGNFTTEEYITIDSGDNVITGGEKMEENKKEFVNINKATQTELETLPGIGPSTALKIISYRNENGAFSSIEDIKNVSGIGDSKFESIKDLICV
jgi:competence protein ComEA